MLTNEEILHVAKLARLKINPDELESYRSKLESVLTYIDQLQAVDTTGIDEVSRGVDDVNVFRADEIEGCDPGARKRIVEAFPRRNGDLLEVQAVFADRE